SAHREQANMLIIGGGEIGSAIARAVSERCQDVFLVEQFPKLGMATSTRNSGVNHSGIYYPKGSLKARLCVEGNRLTYEFCEKHKVPFRHCGKLVVAADGHEQPELLALKKRGDDNGVADLERVDKAEDEAKEEKRARWSVIMAPGPFADESAPRLEIISWKSFPGRVKNCKLPAPRPRLLNIPAIPLRITDGLGRACTLRKLCGEPF